MASGFAPEHGRLPNSPPGAVPCFLGRQWGVV
jgi:hypothetical protein